MRRKKVIIERIDANTLRPKKVKPFNVKRFLKLAKELREAVRKEEEKYGQLRNTPITE